MSSSFTVLVTGGTGKVGSRLTPLLSKNGNHVLVASRSGTAPSLPNVEGLKFDWTNPTTHASIFDKGPVKAIFLIAPMVLEPLQIVKPFIDLAIEKGVKRFVLLGATSIDPVDGPMTGPISKYLLSLDVEYAILRPTWFTENLSESPRFSGLGKSDIFVTAAKDGRIPFVSAEDIAAVGFHALTDTVPHNTDHLIIGPDLLTYDDVAEILSAEIGRKITHTNVSEQEAAVEMQELGLPEGVAKTLAYMDGIVAQGGEERENDVVLNITGKRPKSVKEWVKEAVKSGVWEKK